MSRRAGQNEVMFAADAVPGTDLNPETEQAFFSPAGGLPALSSSGARPLRGRYHARLNDCSVRTASGRF